MCWKETRKLVDTARSLFISRIYAICTKSISNFLEEGKRLLERVKLFTCLKILHYLLEKDGKCNGRC